MDHAPVTLLCSRMHFAIIASPKCGTFHGFMIGSGCSMHFDGSSQLLSLNITNTWSSTVEANQHGPYTRLASEKFWRFHLNVIKEAYHFTFWVRPPFPWNSPWLVCIPKSMGIEKKRAWRYIGALLYNICSPYYDPDVWLSRPMWIKLLRWQMIRIICPKAVLPMRPESPLHPASNRSRNWWQLRLPLGRKKFLTPTWSGRVW